MKKSAVIRQLMLDNPFSITTIRNNEEQKRILDELTELEKQIYEKLDGDKEALNLFEKFKDSLDDLCFEETCCMFERWIKYGVLLGMELAQE